MLLEYTLSPQEFAGSARCLIRSQNLEVHGRSLQMDLHFRLDFHCRYVTVPQSRPDNLTTESILQQRYAT